MTGEPQGVKPATDQHAEVPPEAETSDSNLAADSAESMDATVAEASTDRAEEENANESTGAKEKDHSLTSTDGTPSAQAALAPAAPAPADTLTPTTEAAPELPAAPALEQEGEPENKETAEDVAHTPPETVAPDEAPVQAHSEATDAEPEKPPQAAAPTIPTFAPTLPNPRPRIGPLVPPIQGAPTSPSAAATAATPPAPAEQRHAVRPAPDVISSENAHPLPGLPTAASGDAAEEDEIVEFEPEAYEGMLDSYGPEVAELREGEKRDGAVVSVSEEGAVVDFGGKTEGFLSAKDASGRIDFATLEPGAVVQVVVVRIGEPGEYVKLELAREENNEAWATLEEAYRDHTPLEATALERVKGGLSVMVGGLQAFLPGSQATVHGGDDLDALIGTTFPVAVVKLSRKRGNIVVSARELVEQEIRALKQETLSKLVLGGEAVGEVKNVTSYGAFVDLGGIDGLIHVTDISYGRIKDPAAVLQPGQEVTAKVIKLDVEKERVSLSLKAMDPDPWETVADRYQEGMIVKGAVASVTDYGAFVELEPGVEGLIHITEMTWSKRLRHPSKVLQQDQEIETVVLNVNPAERRISLSLRQRQSDPWESAGERYARGAVVEGRVRNVTSYGAFVEIEEGVDGLVHVSDLTWDARVRNPKEVVQKGQTIQAVVLEVDAENRRMSLGLKQLQPDAWEGFFAEHGLGEILPGLVSRHAKFGYFVELAPGVEGLCHNSQIPHHGKARKAPLSTGRMYEFEIIKVDESNKRIGLRSLSLDPLEEARSE